MSLTEKLYAHPDKFLAAVGGFGGFVFGVATLGWLEGLLAAAVLSLFTYVMAHLDPTNDFHFPKE